MINEQDKKAAVARILSSHEFKDASTYQDLLSFLYETTKSGEPPKEITIAKEVFGWKEFDAERDAKIRVYVYNLRKKLDSYYLNEGKNDKIKLSIPKGHYLITFELNKPLPVKSIHRRLVWINVILVIVLITANLMTWLAHTSLEQGDIKPFTQSLVWNDLLQSEMPTLVVFGDYFLYQDTTSQYKYFVRNPRVNSPQDFEEFVKGEPENKRVFRLTNLTLLGKYTVWCFNDIIRPLLRADVNVELRLASNLQWQDFQKNNILFIGSFKTLRILKNYLANVNFSYQVYPNTLYYHDLDADTTYAYHGPKREESGFVRDYAIVTKLPGPNKNTILTFSSTHDIGHMSVVESFTNPEYLSQFEKEYLAGKQPVRYFVAVFEVQGFERTGFFPKLLHFAEISPDYDFQLP